MRFYPYNFSDADIPAFKRLFIDMRDEGNPPQFPPSVAAAAIAKGFEEGVHFDIVRPLPKFEHQLLDKHGCWLSIPGPVKAEKCK